jgi:hypothetical protein
MGRAVKDWAAIGWAGTGWARMGKVGTGQAKTVKNGLIAKKVAADPPFNWFKNLCFL